MATVKVRDTKTGKVLRTVDTKSGRVVKDYEGTFRSKSPRPSSSGGGSSGTKVRVESDSPQDVGKTFAGQKIEKPRSVSGSNTSVQRPQQLSSQASAEQLERARNAAANQRRQALLNRILRRDAERVKNRQTLIQRRNENLASRSDSQFTRDNLFVGKGINNRRLNNTQTTSRPSNTSVFSNNNSPQSNNPYEEQTGFENPKTYVLAAKDIFNRFIVSPVKGAKKIGLFAFGEVIKGNLQPLTQTSFSDEGELLEALKRKKIVQELIRDPDVQSFAITAASVPAGMAAYRFFPIATKTLSAGATAYTGKKAIEEQTPRALADFLITAPAGISSAVEGVGTATRAARLARKPGIDPTSIFSKQQGFPTARTTKEAVAKLTAANNRVVTVGPGALGKVNPKTGLPTRNPLIGVRQAGESRKSAAGLEDPGIYVAPQGEANPFFLRSTKDRTTEYTLNPIKPFSSLLESFKLPGVTQFQTRGVVVPPKKALDEPGFQGVREFQQQLAGLGKVSVTKRGLIGKGEQRSQINPVTGKREAGTSEIEFVIPRGQRIASQRIVGQSVNPRTGEKIAVREAILEMNTVPVDDLSGVSSRSPMASLRQRVSQTITGSSSKPISPVGYRTPYSGAGGLSVFSAPSASSNSTIQTPKDIPIPGSSKSSKKEDEDILALGSSTSGGDSGSGTTDTGTSDGDPLFDLGGDSGGGGGGDSSDGGGGSDESTSDGGGDSGGGDSDGGGGSSGGGGDSGGGGGSSGGSSGGGDDRVIGGTNDMFFPKQKRQIGRSKTAYDVYVREKKRPVKINRKPLPENKAKRLGSGLVDKTVAASFELRPRGLTRERDINPFSISEKFRPRKTKNALRFVEKEKYRIDSPGEKRGLEIAQLLKGPKPGKTTSKKTASPLDFNPKAKGLTFFKNKKGNAAYLVIFTLVVLVVAFIFFINIFPVMDIALIHADNNLGLPSFDKFLLFSIPFLLVIGIIFHSMGSAT